LEHPGPNSAFGGIKPFLLKIDGEKDFLQNVFSLGWIAEDLERDSQYRSKMPAEEQSEALLATLADIGQQLFVCNRLAMRVRRHGDGSSIGAVR
jgi:hypothetical protein